MGDKKGGDEINYAQENAYMQRKILVLQYRVMIKDEQILGCRKSEEDLRKRIAELDKAFDDEAVRCRENTAEMSRQYREMQESFNETIDVLQKQVSEAKAEIESVTKEIEQVRIDKEEILRQKDLEIASLSSKMETMAFEFADMLKETLDKMSQRIEVTHNSWDRDTTKPPLINRLKAFGLNDEPHSDRPTTVSHVHAMVDVSKPLRLEDFQWNRVCHTRKIQERYQELIKEAQERTPPVDVSQILAERKFESWAAFADTCEKFPLRCRLMDFSELGSGWVLYFYFLRFMMAVLLVFVVAHIPMLIVYATHDHLEEWSTPWNYTQQEHQRPEARHPLEPGAPLALSWMARLSPGSLGVEGASPAIVPMCYFFAIVVLDIMIVFMYALVHKIDEKVDLETTHPNDFAVLVEGLPPSAREDHVIKEFFKVNAVEGRRDVEVVKVVLGWKVAQFQQTAKELKKLRDQRRKQRLKGIQVSASEEADLQKQIEALESTLDVSKAGGELKSAGIAIVVFRKQADQVACLQRWDGFTQRWFYKTGTGALGSLPRICPSLRWVGDRCIS
ncbi:unnamed protein product [Effrenium voratum]|nr:unnamed protein product [Effrenium voratum]